MPQVNPFGGSASPSGPSPDFFFVTQAMCEATLTAGTVPTPAAAKLQKVLRAVEAVSAVTIDIQSQGGGVVTGYAMAAGAVLDRGYIVGIKGLASDTALIGYV